MTMAAENGKRMDKIISMFIDGFGDQYLVSWVGLDESENTYDVFLQLCVCARPRPVDVAW